MIKVCIRGGFGNQLFEYACGYMLAKKNHVGLQLEVSEYDYITWPSLGLDKLNLVYDALITYHRGHSVLNRAVLNKLRKVKAVGLGTKWINPPKTAVAFEERILELGDHIYLQGNFQNIRYFESELPELRKMITPNYQQETEVQKYLEQTENTQSVGVHIRRGDYVKIGCTMAPKYYREAIRLLSERIVHAEFFVVSDDIEYCKDLLGETENTHFVSVSTKNKDLDEFFILKSCRHQIISNSTFSWWAAVLNTYEKKIIVAPAEDMWDQEFCLPGWILIGSR
ncbi:MAG: alpha-1,2-fucosyltransferase [Lachnospiraceae bacterium]|nr:alpha-1,2-fucosyltransferase [Lachnospiraceae bacterium]MCI9132668.1 alpha-1,2-fucosyltransferase [Lachnospiraceae bacterium]